MTKYSANTVERLEEQLQLLDEKMDYLEKQLILKTNASEKFQLKKEIEALGQKRDELIRTLAARYDISTHAGEENLEKVVRQLALKNEIGLLQRVNCNRETMMGDFWENFDRFYEYPFQFYFISSCPTQMPHTFSERSVLELFIQELEEVMDALHIRRDESRDGRLEFFELPSGRNLEKCQKAFRKFFAQYFDLKQTTSFEDFVSGGLAEKGYEYAAIVFRVYERNWKRDFPAYFQWIMDTFSQSETEAPRFLFFFVTYMDGLHRKNAHPERREEILKTIKDLVGKNNAAAHLHPLEPPPVEDLSIWLYQLGETNATRVEAVIDTLVQGLKPEDRQQYEEEQTLNMDDIDILQEVVFRIANE